jgi:hypothetical protein
LKEDPGGKRMRLQDTLAILAIALLLPLCIGCSDDDNGVAPPAEVQLLQNPDVEDGNDLPTEWFSAIADTVASGFTTTWSTEEAVSPTHSLKINREIIENPDAFAFWAQRFNTGIPNGKKITLTASIKTDLTGPGAAIVIRGDDTDPPAGSSEAFVTTQGLVSITGEENWREYWVSMSEVPADILSITVYLILGTNTNGTVYFDDITLTYLE